MVLPNRYRDQPVEPPNRVPRRAAYACFSEGDHAAARDRFHSSFLSLTSEVGPWAEITLISLYNYLTASIKLHNHGEAEEQCRYILGVMQTFEMNEESSFACLECILATSYFLSGNPVWAEEVFTSIRNRDNLGNDLLRDHFNVLSLVRLTTKDCLVFWETSVDLPFLVPVKDYVNQLEGMRPKRNLIRSGLGSLRRMASRSSQHPSTSTSRNAKDGAGWRTSQIKSALNQATAPFDFGFEQRRTKLSVGSPRHVILTPVLADIDGALAGGENAEPGPVVLTDHALEGAPKVDDWLSQRMHLPIPEEPLDPAIGFTHRSMETTTSSMHGQKPPNQLRIRAWPADRHDQYAKELSVLLDDGADKSCISEEFADAMNAQVQQKTEICMTTAIGQEVEVLGKVTVRIAWEARAGTKFAKIKCYVVKDLEVAMLICANVISKLKLRESPSLLAPLLLSARSKQAKQDDARKSQQIAETAKAQEQRESEQRKADRAKLEHIAALRGTIDNETTARNDSLVGGSDTSISSGGSSSTGISHSRTSTPTEQSSRRRTSLESQRSRNGAGSVGHRRSKAVTSLEQWHK